MANSISGKGFTVLKELLRAYKFKLAKHVDKTIWRANKVNFHAKLVHGHFQSIKKIHIYSGSCGKWQPNTTLNIKLHHFYSSTKKTLRRNSFPIVQRIATFKKATVSNLIPLVHFNINTTLIKEWSMRTILYVRMRNTQ